MTNLIFQIICIFWLFYAFDDYKNNHKRSAPPKMKKDIQPLEQVFGKEHCSTLADDFLHYSWRSGCGTYQFHTSAANVEAARSKLQRHFENRGILPRINRNQPGS